MFFFAKGRGKTDRLVKSTMDDASLAFEIEKRFLIICELWMRDRGEELPIPKELDLDLLGWRKMRVRHKKGDLRHSRSEMLSTRAIAQWTLDVNCDLRGQEKKILQWPD